MAPMDVDDDDPTTTQRTDAFVFLKPDWPFGRLRILARTADVPTAVLDRPHASTTFDWAIGDRHFVNNDDAVVVEPRQPSPTPPRPPRPSQAELQFATQDRARFQPSSPGCSPTQLVVSQQRGVVFHGRGIGGAYMPRIADGDEDDENVDDSAIDMQAVSTALIGVPPSQPKPVIQRSQPMPATVAAASQPKPVIPLSQPKPVIERSSSAPAPPIKKRGKVLVKKDGGASALHWLC